MTDLLGPDGEIVGQIPVPIAVVSDNADSNDYSAPSNTSTVPHWVTPCSDGGSGRRVEPQATTQALPRWPAMETNPRGTPRSFETIGRFLSCLLSFTSVRQTTEVRGLHIWHTPGGGCAVEWTGGPHAHEVLQELQLFAVDNQITHMLSPGDISDVEEIYSGIQFKFTGIPFQLRPVETIGIEAVREKELIRRRSRARAGRRAFTGNPVG
jgi:hypothetical protein